MSQITLRTSTDRVDFSPGEEMELIVEWQLDRPADSAEVSLYWYTQGKGESDLSVEWSETISAPGTADRRVLKFTLPDAPYSFSGKFVSLLWAAEIEFAPNDEIEKLDLVIAPGGREVQLYPASVDPAKG